MFCLFPVAWVTNHSSAWSSRSCSGWWSRRRSRCSLKPSSLPPNAPSSVALKVWEEPRYLGQKTAEEWWPRWAWPCPLSNPQEFSPVPPLRTVLPNRRRSRGRRREPTTAPCPEASSGLFNLWTLQGPEWRKLQHWLTGKKTSFVWASVCVPAFVRLFVGSYFSQYYPLFRSLSARQAQRHHSTNGSFLTELISADCAGRLERRVTHVSCFPLVLFWKL